MKMRVMSGHHEREGKERKRKQKKKKFGEHKQGIHVSIYILFSAKYDRARTHSEFSKLPTSFYALCPNSLRTSHRLFRLLVYIYTKLNIIHSIDYLIFIRARPGKKEDTLPSPMYFLVVHQYYGVSLS